MKNKYRKIVLILAWTLLFDLFFLFLDWLDLRCFLDRGPVTLDTVRQFFSYTSPLIELIIDVALAVSLVGVLLKGKNKKASF